MSQVVITSSSSVVVTDWDVEKVAIETNGQDGDIRAGPEWQQNCLKGSCLQSI